MCTGLNSKKKKFQVKSFLNNDIIPWSLAVCAEMGKEALSSAQNLVNLAQDIVLAGLWDFKMFECAYCESFLKIVYMLWIFELNIVKLLKHSRERILSYGLHLSTCSGSCLLPHLHLLQSSPLCIFSRAILSHWKFFVLAIVFSTLLDIYDYFHLNL